jgi:hypothetical protein
VPAESVPEIRRPVFHFVGGNLTGTYGFYGFKSFDGVQLITISCTGEKAQVGDIDVYNNFTSREDVRYLFDSQAASAPPGWSLIELSPNLNKSGLKVGERGVGIYETDQSAAIFWTEDDEYWQISAPSLELAREFENSAAFKLLKTGGFMEGNNGLENDRF